VSNDAEVRDTVRGYILKEFLPGVPASELTDSTPLISGGILDSLATVRLVAMLEERYKVEIEAHEASISHFNSVSDIAALIRDKKVKQ
jgi:acyl carrier protein